MPWPSFGNAFAGEAGPPPRVALETYWHNGVNWESSPIYAHRDGAWRLVSLYRLPADLEVVVPPTPTNTTFAITDLLTGAETLGTVNDSAVFQRCIQRAATRTGPALGVTTKTITVDLEGVVYTCEDPMSWSNLGPRIGVPNLETIIDGNVSNPLVKGGTIAITHDGLNPARISPTTGKYRNRLHWEFRLSGSITVQNLSVTGPNSTGPGNGDFVYDVQREAQAGIQLSGSHHIRVIDCDISSIYGTGVECAAEGGGKLGTYPGMIEVLGGTWRKLGRQYITANQIRPWDGIVDPDFWRNPGDGTGPGETRNSLPYSSDAPSLSGTQYGLWWHGNAAHPFRGFGNKRSVIDVESQTSFSHFVDVRIGADTEGTANVDRQNFLLSGPGNELIACGNGWALPQRVVVSRVRDIRQLGIRVLCAVGPLGGPNFATVDTTMHLDNSFPVPSIVRSSASLAGWPISGYFETTVGVLAPTTIIIKYTGISGLNFTGCTFWDGDNSNRPFVQNRNIKQRYAKPERPKYVSNEFTMIDCSFEGSSQALFGLRGIQHVTLQRNSTRYRPGNNDIACGDCETIDMGTTVAHDSVGGYGPWGNNDFRSS